MQGCSCSEQALALWDPSVVPIFMTSGAGGVGVDARVETGEKHISQPVPCTLSSA